LDNYALTFTRIGYSLVHLNWRGSKYLMSSIGRYFIIRRIREKYARQWD